MDCLDANTLTPVGWRHLKKGLQQLLPAKVPALPEPEQDRRSFDCGGTVGANAAYSTPVLQYLTHEQNVVSKTICTGFVQAFSLPN